MSLPRDTSKATVKGTGVLRTPRCAENEKKKHQEARLSSGRQRSPPTNQAGPTPGHFTPVPQAQATGEVRRV